MQTEKPEATDAPKPFFFKLEADDVGLTTLSFRKDVGRVMGTLLATGVEIVESFDAENRPTTGEFFRMLADMADELDRIYDERNNQQTNDGERSAEEVRAEETGSGVCAADSDLRAECDQGRVPETRH